MENEGMTSAEQVHMGILFIEISSEQGVALEHEKPQHLLSYNCFCVDSTILAVKNYAC